ncbi:MAG: DUF6903 family protein [Anaerorhabdus sp.]
MERTNWTKTIIAVICFLASVALVVIGQKNIGYDGLFLELIGLTGLIIMLYLYNRKFK